MTIRKIAHLGHPVLRQKAAFVPIEDIKTESIQRLLTDMRDTVIDADGAGLAAPQVHESKRIVLLDLDDQQGFQIWINPSITPLSDEFRVGFEGCLSVPNMRGAVARYSKIKVEGWNEKAEPFSIVLEDFPATVAQHECDHLDGIVYIDRIEAGTLAFLEEYNRYQDHLWDMLGEEEDDLIDDDIDTQLFHRE